MTVVGDLANTNHPTIDAYDKRAVVTEILSTHEYLAVRRDGRFAGIITPGDTVANSYKLAIDCVGDKPAVDYSDSVEQVLSQIEKVSCSALPIFWMGNSMVSWATAISFSTL